MAKTEHNLKELHWADIYRRFTEFKGTAGKTYKRGTLLAFSKKGEVIPRIENTGAASLGSYALLNSEVTVDGSATPVKVDIIVKGIVSRMVVEEANGTGGTPLDLDDVATNGKMSYYDELRDFGILAIDDTCL